MYFVFVYNHIINICKILYMRAHTLYRNHQHGGEPGAKRPLRTLLESQDPDANNPVAQPSLYNIELV
jgi:hypothetical protein